VRSQSFQIGSTVGGKYRLTRVIRHDDLGSVVAAENTETGQPLAIKLIDRLGALTPEASERLLREAKACALIRHPNVVDVYEVLAEDDKFCVAMERLDGEFLSAFLAREELPLPQLIRMLLGAMRGVAAAQQRGVSHRAVNPDCMLIVRQGSGQPNAKVLDFGLATLRGLTDLTQSGAGTTLDNAAYMSPEQLSRVPDIDGRADVYALGVILYQAITGQHPFPSETYAGLVLSVMTEQPAPLSALRPDVPPKLCTIVEAAMAKKLEQRTASVEALIAELEPFADDASFGPAPALARRLRSARKTHDKTLRPAAATAPTVSAPLEPESDAVDSATPSPFDDDVSIPARAPRKPLLGIALSVIAAVGVVCGAWALFSAQPGATARSEQHPAEHAHASAAPVAQSGEIQHDPSPKGTAVPAPTAPDAKPEPVAPGPKPEPVAAEAPPTSAPEAEPAAPAPKREPAATSGSAARSRVRVARPSTPAPAPAPPLPAAKPACNPNYYFDGQGNKHFKPECF
jgi:serine/threonine protein kinase